MQRCAKAKSFVLGCGVHLVWRSRAVDVTCRIKWSLRAHWLMEQYVLGCPLCTKSQLLKSFSLQLKSHVIDKIRVRQQSATKQIDHVKVDRPANTSPYVCRGGRIHGQVKPWHGLLSPDWDVHRTCIEDRMGMNYGGREPGY
jgi:hypothetical protein